MAQARKRTVKVPVKVPTYTEETRYELTLTEGEADFLQALVASVGGDEKRSPRKYVRGISKALAYATGETFRDTDAGLLARGAVHFLNYDRLTELAASTASTSVTNVRHPG